MYENWFAIVTAFFYFQSVFSGMLRSSCIFLVSIFQLVYFILFKKKYFKYKLSNTWILLKLLPLFLLKPEVKSLHLKALSKCLVTNVSLSHCTRRCSPRHYRCYSKPLLILLAAMWWIDLCSYGILIYMSIIELTWLSAGRWFSSSISKQYKLNFWRWERN